MNVLGSDQSEERLLLWKELQEGVVAGRWVGVPFPVLPSVRGKDTNPLFLN